MSISTAIENAQAKVENAYTAVEEKGGTLPETQNLSNLPEAIESIPSGGGSGDYIYLENKSGARITADKKVLCNLSAATSKPQRFNISGSTVFNPLCIYNSDNFVATFQSGKGSVIFSDGALKEITQSSFSLSYLAGYRNNIVYHPNGVISSAMASGWTGQDCYIIDFNILVTIPNKCQYLGSYNGTHYVFDRRENYHSIRTYDITTNTIGTEVVSVPDVNFLYYGMMSGDKIFVYKQSYYAIYQLQTATTATLLYSGSSDNLEPMFMTGVGVGEYIISLTNYSAYYDIANNDNKPSFLKIHRIKSDYTSERVHLSELEMFETTPCYFCYDNRSNILSIGTHNYAYFYEYNNGTFNRINVVFDELPNNNGYAYRAYMTPNMSKVIVEGKNNEYHFYDVKYPEQFISVDTSLTYDKDSNITGYATGDTSSGKYEVSTVLPNVSNVSLDFDEYAVPDELSAYGNAGAITNNEKVYQIPAYDNVPFKIIGRKAGYYDLVWDNSCYPSNLPVMSGYSTYTGKNLINIMDNNVVSIGIPGGELPDKSFCKNILGCLKTVNGGQYYENITKIGSAYVDKRTGAAANFSTSNYLTKDLAGLGNNWEIYCKITTPATAINGGQKVFALGTADGSSLFIYGYINNAGTKMWWKIGDISTNQFDISDNTTYYFKLGCDGEKTYVYMSTTGYESMTLVKEESTVISVSAYTMFLGYNPNTQDPKMYFGGIIDLSQTYIKVNGSVYWTAATNQYALYDSTTYGNYITVGTPIFSGSVVSGFTTSKYLTSPLGNLGSTWEVHLKMTTSSSTLTGGQEVFTIGAYSASNGYVYGYINNAGTKMWWVVGSLYVEQFDISNNTTYYFKFGCDGEKTYVYMSTTGYDNMTLVKEEATVVSVPPYTLFLGYNTTNDTKGAFGGSIDLADTYITVNNELYWSGKVVISAIGLLPVGVTDDGSAQTWNLFYDNGEFLADTTSPMTGYSWCGSVAVPAHDVPLLQW